MQKEIVFQVNNKDIHLIQTKKFKTITAIISYIGEVTRDNILLRVMLGRVMGNTCKKYPTKAALANCIYGLYDAGINVRINTSYKTSFMNFIIGTINNKYTNDNEITKKTFELLYEIMYEPNIIDKGFDPKIFNEEKRLLKDEINNVYNNKARYAYIKLLQHMSKEELISLYDMGIIEELEKITPQQLYKFYQKVIKENQVEIYIMGDITVENVKEYLKPFAFNDKTVEMNLYSNKQVDVTEVKEKFEYQDVRQAKLVMGFRVNLEIGDNNYVPLMVFNAMFGGMFGSTLFRTVREENSLAYDIYSQILWDSKILIVAAGVDNNKDSMASDIVIKEFEKYKQGEIEENLMKEAKDFLVSDLSEICDSQYSMLYFNFKESLQQKRTVEQLINEIKKVEVEDIIRACNTVFLDTIYVLKAGKEDE